MSRKFNEAHTHAIVELSDKGLNFAETPAAALNFGPQHVCDCILVSLTEIQNDKSAAMQILNALNYPCSWLTTMTAFQEGRPEDNVSLDLVTPIVLFFKGCQKPVSWGNSLEEQGDHLRGDYNANLNHSSHDSSDQFRSHNKCYRFSPEWKHMDTQTINNAPHLDFSPIHLYIQFVLFGLVKQDSFGVRGGASGALHKFV